MIGEFLERYAAYGLVLNISFPYGVLGLTVRKPFVGYHY